MAHVFPASRRARAHVRWGDHYTGAEILLPPVNKKARGHVVAWNYDANGNFMHKTHRNPILDSRMCQVEIARIEVTELTTNIIAESM